MQETCEPWYTGATRLAANEGSTAGSGEAQAHSSQLPGAQPQVTRRPPEAPAPKSAFRIQPDEAAFSHRPVPTGSAASPPGPAAARTRPASAPLPPQPPPLRPARGYPAAVAATGKSHPTPRLLGAPLAATSNAPPRLLLADWLMAPPISARTRPLG